MKQEIIDKFKQFVKFGIVGISNNIIYYFFNLLILYLLKNKSCDWDYILANVISFLISVLWSFYWNSKFVFTLDVKGKTSVWKCLLKTYISYGFTGIILNNILSFFWIFTFKISKFIAPLINIFITVPVNFILNKYWTFKTENDK